MSRNFKAVGISYKTTPLSVRESVAFDEASTSRFLHQLGEVLGLDEALVLSTCNRTEIYYTSEKDLSTEICSLVDFHQISSDASIAGYFESYNHDEAIEHLFEVSLGLDSMVLGDIQITNQVKKAYQLSADAFMAGPFLHRLLHTIFYTNKRVVQETAFRDGTASLASVAVAITEQFALSYHQPKVAIIGLGDIGSNVAENLKDFNAEICLVNRTQEKAENLAKQYQFEFAPIGDLQQVLDQAHVIISAVQSESPIIDSTNITQGNSHPKLIIDLAVPRSVCEDVEKIPGILLYNVDQLQQKASEALERRKVTIPQVRQIIAENVADFGDWSQEMEVSPAIKKLKQALEDMRQEEMARYLNKLSDKERNVLDKATKSLIQRVIKLPVLQLKAACKRGEADTLVDVLNDLFNLEQKDTKVSR